MKSKAAKVVDALLGESKKLTESFQIDLEGDVNEEIIAGLNGAGLTWTYYPCEGDEVSGFLVCKPADKAKMDAYVKELEASGEFGTVDSPKAPEGVVPVIWNWMDTDSTIEAVKDLKMLGCQISQDPNNEFILTLTCGQNP